MLLYNETLEQVRLLISDFSQSSSKLNFQIYGNTDKQTPKHFKFIIFTTKSTK